MHRSPAYENRLGFFNMQECSSLGAYEKSNAIIIFMMFLVGSQ